MSRILALAICVATSTSAYARPVIHANGGPLTHEWAQSIAERFITCFGLVGPDDLFPRTATIPDPAELLVTIQYLPSPFLVNGTFYTLMFHGRSNSAYAVRSGGFSGAREYFGPISLRAKCPTLRSSHP